MSSTDIIDYYPLYHFAGEKRTMLPWILNNLRGYSYSTVLDLFGGTGIVSYAFLSKGKDVIYNDLMKHLVYINEGLLSNFSQPIELDEYRWLWETTPSENLRLVEKYYVDYFKNDELQFIDTFIQNLFTSTIEPVTKRLLFFALTQSCLQKRPFGNFFKPHKNFRENHAGMDPTWDRSFSDLIGNQLENLNSFQLNKPEINEVKFMNKNALEVGFPGGVGPDLVYLDPPFMGRSSKSRQMGNYIRNYHFFEFLVNYFKYEEPVTYADFQSDYLDSKNMGSLLWQNKIFLQPEFAMQKLEVLIGRYVDSILVFSYRKDFLLDLKDLSQLFNSHFGSVKINIKKHIYNSKISENRYQDVLFVCQN